MVNVKMIGKFYCKAEKCDRKTKTGLCKSKDKSCIYIDYKLIVKDVY